MSGESGAEALRGRPVVDHLYLLLRAVEMYGPAHPHPRQCAEAVAQAVAETGPPFSLQFLSGAAFLDRQLVPLDTEGFRRSRETGAALANLEAHEVSFLAIPDPDDLLPLGTALARGRAGPCDALVGLHVPAVEWREIPQASSGEEGEAVDPDVLVAVQYALALTEAEGLAADAGAPWSWAAGIAVVRRAERAAEVGAHVTSRVLETAPGPWGVARRAVVMAFHAELVLRSLGVGRSVRRAASHAALAVGLAGLGDREGRRVDEAALAALDRLVSAREASRGGVEPHRVRTCALVHALALPARGVRLAAADLVQLLYALACVRRPRRAPVTLALVELLGLADQAAGKGLASDWLAAFRATFGPLPAGTRVRLAEGVEGVVAGPGAGGDASRPQVLVNGRLLEPGASVSVLQGVGGPGAAP